MRIEFINAAGGKMLVDESRVEEYKAAGYMLAASVIDDNSARLVSVEKIKPVKTRKAKEV